jgi:hypothetical protein
MKLKCHFIIIWITAAFLLTLLVNWRVTVPVNDQGLFMVKDEAGYGIRLVLGAAIGGIYSAVNVALIALVEKWQNKAKRGEDS